MQQPQYRGSDSSICNQVSNLEKPSSIIYEDKYNEKNSGRYRGF